MRLIDTHLRLTGAVLLGVECEPAAVASEADRLLVDADGVPDMAELHADIANRQVSPAAAGLAHRDG